jgi:hypothetical protein
LATGSALTFDGTNLFVGGTIGAFGGTQKGFAAESGTVIAVLNGESANSVGSVGTVSNHDFSFKAYGSEQMRLTSKALMVGYTSDSGFSGSYNAGIAGSLGIGTSSPASKLHVQDATANNGTIQLGGTTYYGTVKHDGVSTGAMLYNVASASGGGHQFQRGGTTLMNLDSAGNLGLGVTPSAWSASFKSYQAGTAAAFVGSTLTSQALVLANAYSDAVGLKYKNSDFAAYYQQYQGVHAWYTAPSGTAGDPITFTQAMSLNASGQWLLNTTAPIYSNADAAHIYGKVSGSNQYGLMIGGDASTYTCYAARFLTNNSGSVVGSITFNTGATAYNTSSDYRLKNVTGPITTSGAYIDSLNPVEGTWKADGSTFVGLIAHEVQEASRTPVATGIKDGEEMQAMDYSNAEIIANLIAEIQSLRKRLATAGI